MSLDEHDFRLSMLVSQRSRDAAHEPTNLRTLLIHRLRDRYKAIGRVPLKSTAPSVFCEPCERWVRLLELPPSWTCPHCQRLYVLETAIYTNQRDARDDPETRGNR